MMEEYEDVENDATYGGQPPLRYWVLRKEVVIFTPTTN